MQDSHLGLILNLWALIEGLKAINKTCEVLKNPDEKFKRILAEERSQFVTYFEHVDSLIVIMLTMIANGQYDVFQCK